MFLKNTLLILILVNDIQQSNAFSCPKPTTSNRNIVVPNLQLHQRTGRTTHKKSSEALQASSKIIDEDILSQLETCTSGTKARQILTKALLTPNQSQSATKNTSNNNNDGNNVLYNSLSIPPLATSKSISDADLAIQTQIRNSNKSVLDLIELNGDADIDRISLFLFGLTIGSPLTAILTTSTMTTANNNNNLLLPPIIQFMIVWLGAFAPFIFVGAGLTVPTKLQQYLITIQSFFFPSYQTRMIQHEAGHLLMGHLLGWPIQSYKVQSSSVIQNAVEFYPLADVEVGLERANVLGFDAPKKMEEEEEGNRRRYEERLDLMRNADRPFFSEGGGGDQLLQNSVFADSSSSLTKEKKGKKKERFKSLVSVKDDVSSVWPYRKLDENSMDILSVVSLAGVCAEIIGFGNAQGGLVDLSQLTAILKANDCTEDEIENKIRFAIGFNFSQLRRHLGVLDEVAKEMENGKSVVDCVKVMESCENPMGPGTLVERYEDIRKRDLEQSWNLLEKAFLGRSDAVNGERMDVIEGKGGGGTKEKFAMTGDDPLYAALALAFAFFVWASSGGLSLH